MALLALALAAPMAKASTGYEPDATEPQIPLSAELTHGVAIDQGTQQIYVAVYVKALIVDPTGEVIQLLPDGTPTVNSPFAIGASAFFSGVAVDPLTHNLYASRESAETPFGKLGESRMHLFSSTGTGLSSFALPNPVVAAPQIATDSSGRVYYPNRSTDAVEVFDSAGALQSTITCVGCPGGTFAAPISVAVDAADNVYVVDLDKDFVVKLKPASESFAFERQFQSGREAGAVAVDSTTGDVFVGDLPGGSGHHIVAYDSTGVQFDDFAAGMTVDPPAQAGRGLTPQMAVNETTHQLYVSDQNRLLVFERTTINPPTASIDAATSVTQLKATLNASVNANGHAVIDCQFEYVDHTDFLTTGFTDATSAPCLTKPSGTSATPLSRGVTGLTPSTTYHYRVMAENNAGADTSGAQTFATLPEVPPTVTAQPATGIGQTKATLTGKVNPQGGSVTDCHFEYGTSTTYGTNSACASLPGAVTVDVPQSRGITGLTSGLTYHYRLVVTSNAGTTKGADVEFTTQSVPQPTPPPSNPPSESPPPAASPPPAITLPVAPKPLRCKKGFRKKKVRGKLRCVKKPRKRRVAARKRSG